MSKATAIIFTIAVTTPLSVFADSMDTMPVDADFYKAHAPFEHVQYVVPRSLPELDGAIQKHFQSKGWVETRINSNTDSDFEFSREAFDLTSDLLSDRLPLIRQQDLKADNKMIGKWKRTQRYKDWSETPAWITKFRAGGRVDCRTFTSPAIRASIPGATNSFKDELDVCFSSRKDSNVLKVGVLARTLHLIEGRHQLASGQVGVLWLPWLNGTRLANELADLHTALTNPDKNIAAPAPGKKSNIRTVSSGSGFFVSERAVITNQHVIDGCKNVSIVGLGEATVLAEDKNNDLAIVFSQEPTDSYLKLSDDSVQLGQNIAVLGYPLQQVLSPTIHMTKGNVSSLAGLAGNTAFFQMTAPIQPGNSGGPVIDDQGAVMGVATSTLSPQFAMRELGTLPQGVNFAIRTSLVRSLLEIYGIAVGSSFGELPAREAGVFKLECLK